MESNSFLLVHGAGRPRTIDPCIKEKFDYVLDIIYESEYRVWLLHPLHHAAPVASICPPAAWVPPGTWICPSAI